MTQQEFYDRTMVRLSDDEFWKMHEDYCNSLLDKDEYCKQWVSNKYIEASERVSVLMNQLKEVNRDIKGTPTTSRLLNGRRNIRHIIIEQLYEAHRAVNKWRDIADVIL